MSGYGDILLVEDNQADMRLTMHILSETRNTHRVQVPRDGKEALDVIFGADHQLGANGYVQKPVVFEQFEDIVRRHADFWLGANLPASPAVFCDLVSPRDKAESGRA